MKPGGSARYPNPKDKTKVAVSPRTGPESEQERKERIRRIRKGHPK